MIADDEQDGTAVKDYAVSGLEWASPVGHGILRWRRCPQG